MVLPGGAKNGRYPPETFPAQDGVEVANSLASFVATSDVIERRGRRDPEAQNLGRRRKNPGDDREDRPGRPTEPPERKRPAETSLSRLGMPRPGAGLNPVVTGGKQKNEPNSRQLPEIP